MEELIKRLKTRIDYIEQIQEPMNATSWLYEEGILISGNEAKEIIDLYFRMKGLEK